MSTDAVLPSYDANCEINKPHHQDFLPRGQALDLFRTPASICLSHILRWLDGWDEFQHSIDETDNNDNTTGNVPDHRFVKEDRSDEYVNCMVPVSMPTRCTEV